MNDNDIIRATECCTTRELKCEDCPYDRTPHECRKVYVNIINLAKKQKAEIERLTINMNAFRIGMKREKERADTARSDAIKDFAERLKE